MSHSASTSNDGGEPVAAGERTTPEKISNTQSRGDQEVVDVDGEGVGASEPPARSGRLVLWDIHDMLRTNARQCGLSRSLTPPSVYVAQPLLVYSRRRKETLSPLEMVSAPKCLNQRTFRGCDNRNFRGNQGRRKHPAMALNPLITVEYKWCSAHSSRGSG